MKKNLLLKRSVLIAAMAVCCTGLISFSLYGNSKTNTENKTEKRIEITEENGQKKVKVTTIENGKTTIETYTGEDADRYLRENGHETGKHNFNNGNGNFRMQFDFDADSGDFSFFNHFDFNDSTFRQMHDDLEKAMKELEKSGFHMHFDFDKFSHSFDTMFSNGPFKMYMYKDFNDLDKNIDSMLNNIDVDVYIDEDPAHGKSRKIVIARSVMIEDVKDKKHKAEPEISDLKFYPNPNNGTFTLKYNSESNDAIKINITNMQGKTIYTGSTSGMGKIELKIDLGPQPSGAYMLHIEQGKKGTSKKLIIE